jgi:hypothetical protein
MNYPIVRYSTPFRFGPKAAHHSLALLLCLFLLVESVARASALSPRIYQSGPERRRTKGSADLIYAHASD